MSGSIITPVDGGRRPEPVRESPVEEAPKPLSNTFLKVMCGGTSAEVTVGGYVNMSTPSPRSVNLQDWVCLARVDPQVLDVCLKIIPKTGRVKAQGQLAQLLAKRRLAGRAVPDKTIMHQPQGGV